MLVGFVIVLFPKDSNCVPASFPRGGETNNAFGLPQILVASGFSCPELYQRPWGFAFNPKLNALPTSLVPTLS